MKLKLRRWLRRFGTAGWSGWPQQVYRTAHYQQRLAAVQMHLGECIDLAPAGLVRIVSLCAGDGRDVIGTMVGHRRRGDVRACLVELNEHSVGQGIESAKAAGVDGQIKFIAGDATDFASYQGYLPCDIMLVCGVWGHVPPLERERLVASLAKFGKQGSAVVWTRGVSRGMSRLDDIQEHFVKPIWERVRLTFTQDEEWAVVTHRYCGSPQRTPPSGRVFEFHAHSGK
jgi:hypothetical protein